jgi:hypothetical protein
MYEIKLTQGAWMPLFTEQFRHSTDGSLAVQKTEVHLKYDANFLHIRFKCHDNPFVSQNSMAKHNDNLFNQEVFELFIAASDKDSVNYLEFEINPNNAIWVGHVFNPTLGESGDNKLMMVPYNEAEITHDVKVMENAWLGEFALPWKLIGGQPDVCRINFYRIVSNTSHENSDWVCTPDTCDFTCWSPTMSGKNPAFHKPKKFGVLRLV